MRRFNLLCSLLFFLLAPFMLQPLSGQKPGRMQRMAESRLSDWVTPIPEWHYPEDMKIDSVGVDVQQGEVSILLPAAAAQNPVREETLARLVNSVREILGRRFSGYSITILCGGRRIEEFIPNYFRYSIPKDAGRIPPAQESRPRLIQRIGSDEFANGLDGRYIALWHSHGYYFDMTLDRWEWQRAKLFGSVEDLSVMAYVVPYLVPMLENSGATVFLPRERDIQVREVIVDNNGSTGNSEFVLQVTGPPAEAGPGFLLRDTLFSGDNPFLMGTSLTISDGSALFVPEIPEKGSYGVTVSWPCLTDAAGKVLIRVSHTGGVTEFIADQSAGGGTWVWLGSFIFDRGLDRNRGSVTLTSADGSPVAVDAVRFGGGMGNVARRPSSTVTANQWSLNAGEQAAGDENHSSPVDYSWKLSGKPRYLEAARYWLQYAGMPDTLVYTVNKGRNDYNDDYMSRSEWVNYLLREPDSTNGNGLGIPVDLSLAFHTDAGITPDDSIIGTLGIYSTATNEGRFPDGTSRLASRDLTDIIQTQIVEDIYVLFNPDWTRRAMWDRSYYEARKPDVPAMLLELLSHQNLADQRYGFDPRFRFHVSRAVYKGILRYLTNASGTEYTVHPLPVSHMTLVPLGGKSVRLSWEPVSDPLESTADPTSYRVFMAAGSNGFDNGREVTGTTLDIELPSYNMLYRFRVTALNEGGESFPSETLSAGFVADSRETVLVVNGFDRISGPSWFDRNGMAGVAWWDDRGVADHYNFSNTGDQYDFDRRSPWTDDDNAGWGASWSDGEGKIIPGNTFDFPAIHGSSIMAAGRSFTSVSDESFNTPEFDLRPYAAIDLLFGEEKSTPSAHDPGRKEFQIYTNEFMLSLERVTEASLPIFISGAYIGTDLMMAADSVLSARVMQLLHFKPRTGHAARTGEFYATDIAGPDFSGRYSFNTGNDTGIYAAESPDAIEPADKSSGTAFRYSENNTSACVIHGGEVKAVVAGFPFETILLQEERDRLMKQILDFILKK